MGLKLHALEVIKDCLPFSSVLSLGYPDIVVPRETVEDLFEIEITETTQFGSWHGVSYPLPESASLFARLGATLKCVDVHQSRGIEEIVDLNYPTTLGSYDLVLDGGTIEHCFHIGQALINAASAVAKGGRIFHANPMSCVNHGFYNLCPTLYWDFYSQNGWKIERFYGLDWEQNCYEVHNVKRFLSPPELHMVCVARRVTDAPLAIPVQEKYRRNPNLH